MSQPMWYRNQDGTIRRIGRLPVQFKVSKELLIAREVGQIVPKWYAPAYAPWDQDSIVFAPMGLHWVLRFGRWVYYGIRLSYPPEWKELHRLRRENGRLKKELFDLTENRFGGKV